MWNRQRLHIRCSDNTYIFESRFKKFFQILMYSSDFLFFLCIHIISIGNLFLHGVASSRSSRHSTTISDNPETALQSNIGDTDPELESQINRKFYNSLDNFLSHGEQ